MICQRFGVVGTWQLLTWQFDNFFLFDFDRPPVERCKSAPKLGSIEESPEQEEVEEKDWLRVLAQRSASGQQLRPKCSTQNSSLPLLRTLETVCEEERCHSPPAQLSSRSHSLTSIPDNPSEAGGNGPDDVSPNGLQVAFSPSFTYFPRHFECENESSTSKSLRRDLMSDMLK